MLFSWQSWRPSEELPWPWPPQSLPCKMLLPSPSSWLQEQQQCLGISIQPKLRNNVNFRQFYPFYFCEGVLLSVVEKIIDLDKKVLFQVIKG